MLTTGRTTAKLGPLARFGRSLGNSSGLNIGLGAAETAMRTAEGDALGATLAGASMVPGPTGMAAAAGLIVHDINKAFPTSSIRGRSGAQRAMMGRQNPSFAIPEPPSNQRRVVVIDEQPTTSTIEPGVERNTTSPVPPISHWSHSAAKRTTLGL